MLAELTHFRAAIRYRLSLTVNGLIFLVAGYALLSAARTNAILGWDISASVPHATGYLAASLLVTAAGFLSSSLMVYGRLLAVTAHNVAAEALPADSRRATLATRWLATKRLASWGPQFHLTPEWFVGWPQVLVSLVLGAAAIAATITTWRLGVDQTSTAPEQQVFSAIVILLTFPLLVLERIYANTDVKMLPEAPQLDRLLRVPILTFVGIGLTSMLGSFEFAWPTTIERAIAIVIGLVALELIVRGVAAVFLPFAPIDERHSTADSRIALLLRLSPLRLAAVSRAIKHEFGIDLSRSWAIAFVRWAGLPIALALAVFAWCITGVTALGLSERAVYERFGVPVTVFGPGIHAHLPWPLGIVRTVEFGVVHQIPVVVPSGGERRDQAGDAEQSLPGGGAEDLPPQSADRLWDASHPSEASYLIASESQGKQSFQVANIDMRVVYRVGLSDAAARNSIYAVVDPESLIRAGAGELLMRYFARYALIDVLGQSRERFTNDFRNELQEGLDKLSSGLDVIAVIVEAIHPPAGAAAAFHNVQAAEINARSAISLHRAGAIRTVKAAQRDATEDQNRALAAASEFVNRASGESILFRSDRQAYNDNRQAFLLERWLDRLSSGLAKSNFVVVDSRLAGMNAPTIDLRRFGSALGATELGSPIRKEPAPHSD